MSEDASLDEFLDSGSEDDAEPVSDEASGDDAESVPGGVPEDGAESATADEQPATTTYAWDGDGAACADCGEVVERRWEQDGALVCVACKVW